MRLAALLILAGLLIGFAAWKLCFPRGTIPRTIPALEQAWDQQVYHLDEDEALRFVSPSNGFKPGPAVYSPFRITAGAAGVHCGYVVEPQRVYQMGGANGPDNIRWAIRWCANLGKLDFELPEHLPPLPDGGNWFFRDETPTPRRMQALQSILSALAGREMIIENAPAEREVVVASGEWMLRALEDDADPGFYTGFRSSSFFTFGTLDESLRELEKILSRKIINEVSQPPSKLVGWRGPVMESQDLDTKALDKRLAVLQKQTSLKFRRERRTIPIWFLRERFSTTQPVSAK